jgi:hypothetical protein
MKNYRIELAGKARTNSLKARIRTMPANSSPKQRGKAKSLRFVDRKVETFYAAKRLT